MTAPGAACPDTPIAGLVELALTAPTFQKLIERASDRPDELPLAGPASARLFVASALAQHGPLLVVTATGREADDLSAELRGVFGDAVAVFPSWETLPHERMSPGIDTVGTRMLVLRRLAHPDDARLGPPLRVVVTAVRSLLQPMAPQLGRQEPLTLTVGDETPFEDVGQRLVELAYTRVDMVGRRGEFAVRGGILDIFAPTAEHPVRVEFWGDEITEMRMFSVADQRSIPEIEVDTLLAVACRELLLTDEVRARAAALVAQHPPTDNTVTGSIIDMLAKLAEGIPVDGMEALLPVLRPDDHALLTDQLADGTPVLVCDPEKVRTRAADLIKTGREFLEASWSVAALGADAPVDVEQLGGSGFAELDDVHTAAAASDHPWWTTLTVSSRCCAHTSRPPATPRSSRLAPGRRTAWWSGWANPISRRPCSNPARRPNRVSSACSRDRCTTASSCPGPISSSSPKPT
jgi:transcription-repair coupling factor (superfamily II helicase)